MEGDLLAILISICIIGIILCIISFSLSVLFVSIIGLAFVALKLMDDD